eukprot:2915363-Pyramimonas_sp.AAC.1
MMVCNAGFCGRRRWATGKRSTGSSWSGLFSSTASSGTTGTTTTGARPGQPGLVAEHEGRPSLAAPEPCHLDGTASTSTGAAPRL